MAPDSPPSAAAQRSVRVRIRWRTAGLVALAAAMVAGAVVVLPGVLPNLVEATGQNPFGPVLVTLCWLIATLASITGKRLVAAGHMGWVDTIAAHIGGTVANRVIPVGMGASGAYVAALRRGGASATTATGTVALWAAAGGVAQAVGLLLAFAWLQGGERALAVVIVVAVVVLAVGPRVVRRSRTATRAVREQQRTPAHTDQTRRTRAALRRGLRNRLLHAVAVAREVFRAARARPLIAAGAVLAQLAAMLSLALGFAAAVASSSMPVALIAATVAYVTANALSAAAPTPAGIGSAEATLVGALVLAGANVGEAVPTVLLFRGVVLLAPVAAAALLAAAWLAIRPTMSKRRMADSSQGA